MKSILFYICGYKEAQLGLHTPELLQFIGYQTCLRISPSNSHVITEFPGLSSQKKPHFKFGLHEHFAGRWGRRCSFPCSNRQEVFSEVRDWLFNGSTL